MGRNKNIENSTLHRLVHDSIHYVPFFCGYSICLLTQNPSRRYCKPSSCAFVGILEFRRLSAPLTHVLWESVIVKDMSAKYTSKAGLIFFAIDYMAYPP